MESKETLDLYDEFKRQEQEAEELALFPEGAFPCIRLDGHRHSKIFLKNHLLNQKYSSLARKSAVGLFKTIRTLFDRELKGNVVCFLTYSDEVSFILVPSFKNERFGRRIMKICTMMAGSLSSLITSHMRREASDLLTKDWQADGSNKWTPQIVSYDARPICLADEDAVVRYIRHRYLLAKRNAYWKVLNLRKHHVAHDSEKKNDLDLLMDIVVMNGWEGEAKRLLETFTMFFADDVDEYIKIECVTGIYTEPDTLSQLVRLTLKKIGYVS
jgi:hypothetical protein